MKTMFLAAAAALTLGMGSAFAQNSPSASGYVYSNFWGQDYSQPAAKGQSVSRLNGNSVGIYTTRSRNAGTWLFPPNPNSGG
jgi:hypothetical protein